MSPGVVSIRADICADCPTPCAWQRDPAALSDPCAACPAGRWHTWDCSSSASPPTLPAPAGDTSPTGMRGLGDVVAVVAGPVGHALGLDPARCGCARRQATLNEAVPFRGDADPGVVV